MSEFWTWGKLVSWENCIEINRICNFENCPDTMNCCVSNCMGVPTIKGIVVCSSIAIIVVFFIWVFSTLRETKKYKKEKIQNANKTN